MHNVASLNLSELRERVLAHLSLHLRSFSFSFHTHIQFDPVKFSTFGCRLHGDLVTEVAAACSGHSGSPDQVLLPMVEVGDSVEEKLRVGLILAGHLRRHGRENVQAELSN